MPSQTVLRPATVLIGPLQTGFPTLFGMSPAFSPLMHPAETTSTAEPAGERDIVFACVHCAASFVVDAAAAGVTLACQSCGRQTTVPHPNVETAAGTVLRISELQHQLKENESQHTEVTGYINQLNIQLHRWQLRLQTLGERRRKLQSDLEEIL